MKISSTRHRALIFGVQHHLVNFYQFVQIIPLVPKNVPAARVSYAYIKSTFSEYGHVAYQIKGKEACSNMLANSLVLHLRLIVHTKQMKYSIGFHTGLAPYCQ